MPDFSIDIINLVQMTRTKSITLNTKGGKMKKRFTQEVNDIILLMYQEQQRNNRQTSKNLSNYINKLDKLETYQIVQQLIADGLTNWKVRKGVHDDVVITHITPNLTRKGIKTAEFLIKPASLRFLISTKNKITALIIILLGILCINININ